MTKKVCMGNEAIALGAIDAKVRIVTGYPGTPSTEIIETIIKEKNPTVNVQWSTNEKVALEVAAGAAYTGARSLVTMKQVGLNVASDPLMSLTYIGVEGGMVLAVADDPGPWSSQTEQDTRNFARNANLPVFDPCSPEEAYEMTRVAFDLSEEFRLPVFIRPTTRVCHASATINLTEAKENYEIKGFEKKPDWCIFPPLAYKKHGELEVKQNTLSNKFDTLTFNSITGTSKKGVAASGVSYLYAKEVIKEFNLDVTLFKVGTPYPMPEGLSEEFISSVDSIIVFEELDPVVEEGLLLIGNGRVPIYGKRTGHLPFNGEYSYELVKKALFSYLKLELTEDQAPVLPQMPVRPPVLCAGCPHRASFYETKIATEKIKKVVYCGDIGCYTLGNAAPLNMVDTCLCMGGGITIAQGIALAEPETKCVAFIGDSTFFHTGIPGIINAVYQNTDITIVVLDNRTTAMTGHQPHPGTGVTAMGEPAKALDIEMMLRACGVEKIYKVNPFDYKNSVDEFKKAVEYDGPSAIIAKAPCIAQIKLPSTVHRVNENCIGCLKCIKKLGCPALIHEKDGKVVINESLCTDCSLCANVCPVGAIKRGDRNA
ncbi:MAG: indolepyruvate ferredoxin oxidoreductase subunit alpha [Synergistaceae bacterium]